jgi:hypothetical protein
MSRKRDDLKVRVEAKRRRMRSKLAELEVDTSREARAAFHRIARALHELELLVEHGWARLGDGVRLKLDAWEKRN